MAPVSERMAPETVQPFWAALQRGEFVIDAAAEIGTYRIKGHRWLVADGGRARAMARGKVLQTINDGPRAVRAQPPNRLALAFNSFSTAKPLRTAGIQVESNRTPGGTRFQYLSFHQEFRFQ